MGKNVTTNGGPQENVLLNTTVKNVSLQHHSTEYQCSIVEHDALGKNSCDTNMLYFAHCLM